MQAAGKSAVYEFAGTELKRCFGGFCGQCGPAADLGPGLSGGDAGQEPERPVHAAAVSANSIVRAGSLFYLLGDNAVECFDASGTRQWSQTLAARPQALLADSKTLLLFSGNTVQKLGTR